MPPLMKRIEREVLEGKQRAKNRMREHAHHGWFVVRTEGPIVLMECPLPCKWIGWMSREVVGEK